MQEEPEIIINGQNLGPGCAMTMRVAIQVFADELIQDLKDNPDNECFVKSAQNYLNRINDIHRAMKVIE